MGKLTNLLRKVSGRTLPTYPTEAAEAAEALPHEFTGFRYMVLTPSQESVIVGTRREARAEKRRLRSLLGPVEQIVIERRHYNEFGYMDDVKVIT